MAYQSIDNKWLKSYKVAEMTNPSEQYHLSLPNEDETRTVNRSRNINRLASRFAAQRNGCNPNGAITNASAARKVALQWIDKNLSGIELQFGLPEVDDRYKAWRISLIGDGQGPVGELMIRCSDGEVIRGTKPIIIRARLFPKQYEDKPNEQPGSYTEPPQYFEFNDSYIVLGDAREVLRELPKDYIDLVITSPPYYNAKPEYSEYPSYATYLLLLRSVFAQCHRTLKEGRFLIVNASPVLIRRPSRNHSSKRIPVPFHINSLLEEMGFEFVDDIIWMKPAGAGWNTGRGRRFAADRHPLQYKPVPVTEYFLVYRKATEKLIDWNIRNHPNQKAVRASSIADGYEVSNVWYAKPGHSNEHPAVFPIEIIEKLVCYYSFEGDIVLDPFAGIGTVGKAAMRHDRKSYLIDIEKKFFESTKRELLLEWQKKQSLT